MTAPSSISPAEEHAFDAMHSLSVARGLLLAALQAGQGAPRDGLIETAMLEIRDAQEALYGQLRALLPPATAAESVQPEVGS